MGQAEQDPDLPRSASNDVLSKVRSLLCLSGGGGGGGGGGGEASGRAGGASKL